MNLLHNLNAKSTLLLQTQNSLSFTRVVDPHHGLVFRCLQCAHITKTHVGMYYHINQHKGIFPYYCPLCSQGQLGTTNLGRHLRSAHKMIQLECWRCDLKFNKVLDYVKHMKQCEYIKQCSPTTDTWSIQVIVVMVFIISVLISMFLFLVWVRL